jgi:L-alanine-DL-glutamate epimerase-like enolase superfamily enzyme
MARVVEVAVARLSKPLHTPFVTALRRTSTVTSAIVRLTDDEGQVGFGEAPQVWRVTGESLPGIEACVLGPLAGVLLGWHPGQALDPFCAALDQTVCAAREAAEGPPGSGHARRVGVFHR